MKPQSLVEVATIAVTKTSVKTRHVLVRSGVARISLVHGVGRGGSSVEGLGGPLAVAVEAVAVSDAVSKAETLSRPVGGGNSVSGVDGNSSVEGLGAPLAVVALLRRSAEPFYGGVA